ncbi:hypothetical protein GPJ56_003935 [Histomonas meleagridis]|uniref:uncharacterized protein n=1 Tax=Histomonas meleagridis TaxID=135588 RepID=UPI0035595C04|nr:hypothetical protein GPJ56_003935 [Histomonas meleagridis]KAH0797522.1 hypothetical protein GO595_009625 [Histomonas meleagridis]
MNKETFATVAKDVLSFKTCEGLSVTYQQGTDKVTMKTQTDLSDPSVQVGFKLQQTTVEIESGNKTKVTITPDLSKYGATLSINPLDNGSFKFSVKKECDKTGALTLSYSSEDKKPSLELMPKLNYGIANVSGKVNFAGSGKPSGMLELAIKDFNIRSSYNIVPDEIKAGVFYNNMNLGPLKNIGCGAIYVFKPENQLMLCAKSQVNSLELSTIFTVMEKSTFKPSCLVRGLLSKQIKSFNVKIGESIEYKGSKVDNNAAIEVTTDKYPDTKLNMKLDNLHELSTKFETALPQQIPFLGTSKVSLCLVNELEKNQFLHPSIGFGVTFKN